MSKANLIVSAVCLSILLAIGFRVVKSGAFSRNHVITTDSVSTIDTLSLDTLKVDTLK